MKISRSILILLVFLFQLPTGIVSKKALSDTNVSVFNSAEDLETVSRIGQVIGYWSRPPSVRICDGAPVTMTRVYQAVEFWRRLGYEIGPITRDSSADCSFTRIEGSIMIGLPDQNFIEPNLAMTRTLTSDATREIIMAKIAIKPRSSTRERVLEHEFGHALGWRHFNRRYHLMNSELQRGGWTTTGLRRSELIEKLYESFPNETSDLRNLTVEVCEE